MPSYAYLTPVASPIQPFAPDIRFGYYIVMNVPERKAMALRNGRHALMLLVIAVSVLAAAADGGAAGWGSGPVYRVPVRIHLGQSGRNPYAFRTILEEINEIWLTQAGICFEMQITLDDRADDDGMDLWFRPELEEGAEMNGVFRGIRDIQVRDTPNLGPSVHPARHPAARTAAHELGHGLGLPHRQDSDDNLMRSKTFGWQLNDAEVRLAREAAKSRALPDTARTRCRIVNP